jgi:hypothetical protein
LQNLKSVSGVVQSANRSANWPEKDQPGDSQNLKFTSARKIKDTGASFLVQQPQQPKSPPDQQVPKCAANDVLSPKTATLQSATQKDSTVSNIKNITKTENFRQSTATNGRYATKVDEEDAVEKSRWASSTAGIVIRW